MPAWTSRYVGIPFADSGDDISSGVNCYGLLRTVFAREVGIDLPCHSELSAADIETSNTSMLADIAGGPWTPVEQPLQLFDVVLLRGNPMHVGLLVSPDVILHIWRKTDSMLMPIDHPRIRHRIIGYYRHKDLA